VIDRELGVGAELAGRASEGKVGTFEGPDRIDRLGGAELMRRVTLVVAVARGTFLGNTMPRAVMVDGILRMLTVRAACTLIFAALDC
jgi:hypothetical protein